jgi:plasmid stabilization system protein ParE
MKQYEIVIEDEANEDLRNIYDFISTNDTQMQAKRFLHKLQRAILSLDFMPYRCRPSRYWDNESARDMIIQGYTIVYIVTNQTVHILAVFRQREL